MSCNEGQFDVVEVINLNAQHVNGMTHFDLVKLGTFIRYSRVVLNQIKASRSELDLQAWIQMEKLSVVCKAHFFPKTCAFKSSIATTLFLERWERKKKRDTVRVELCEAISKACSK